MVDALAGPEGRPALELAAAGGHDIGAPRLCIGRRHSGRQESADHPAGGD
jgi:plasmid stability protein